MKDFEIKTTENLVSSKERAMLWKLANNAEYTHSQGSDSTSHIKQRRMVHRMEIDFVKGLNLWTNLTNMFKGVDLFDAYINYSDSATFTLPHTDNDKNEPSVLILLNPKWDRDWCGYTVFFESIDSSKILQTICPVAGQSIIFNGSIFHYALPVTRLCPVPRFMLALKLGALELRV